MTCALSAIAYTGAPARLAHVHVEVDAPATAAWRRAGGAEHLELRLGRDRRSASDLRLAHAAALAQLVEVALDRPLHAGAARDPLPGAT